MKIGKMLLCTFCVLTLAVSSLVFAAADAPGDGADAGAAEKEALVTDLLKIWDDSDVAADSMIYDGEVRDYHYEGLRYRYNADGKDYRVYFSPQTGKLVNMVNLSRDKVTATTEELLSRADATVERIYGSELFALCRRGDLESVVASNNPDSLQDYNFPNQLKYRFIKDGVTFPAADFLFRKDGTLERFVMYHPQTDGFNAADFLSEEESFALAKDYGISMITNSNPDVAGILSVNEEKSKGLLVGKGDPAEILWQWTLSFDHIASVSSVYIPPYAIVHIDAVSGELAFIAVPEEAPTPTEEVTQEQRITSFLTRLYADFLGREPDERGLSDWKDALISGLGTGAKVVYGFVYSPEFQANPLDNEAYVTAMYRTVFGREPDEAGLRSWVSVLDRGCTRKKILEGFLNSKEMAALCEDMGVKPGSYHSDDVLDRNVQYTYFVNRFYQLGLGREADAAGIRAWVTALAQGKVTGKSVALSFFDNKEFWKRYQEAGIDAALTGMTLAMLDREPTEAERESWTLSHPDHWAGNIAGWVFDYLLNFVTSEEYAGLCARYDVAV